MIHTKKYPKETKGARALVYLIHKRRNMMHYLAKTDYHKYKWICIDYGIPEVPPKDGHHKTDFKLRHNSFTGY